VSNSTGRRVGRPPGPSIPIDQRTFNMGSVYGTEQDAERLRRLKRTLNMPYTSALVRSLIRHADEAVLEAEREAREREIADEAARAELHGAALARALRRLAE
jgi:hypothetical protein